MEVELSTNRPPQGKWRVRAARGSMVSNDNFSVLLLRAFKINKLLI